MQMSINEYIFFNLEKGRCDMIEQTITLPSCVSDLLRIALAHPVCNTSFM